MYINVMSLSRHKVQIFLPPISVSRLFCNCSARLNYNIKPLDKLLNATKALSNCGSRYYGTTRNGDLKTFANGVEGRPAYLDAQTTKSLDPVVLDALPPPYFTSFYGNPHPTTRTHAYGWESINTAKDNVKEEHKCTLNSCRPIKAEGLKVTYLPVQSNGVIDLDQLKEAMTPQTSLVSIMTVNNEIGVKRPIPPIGIPINYKIVPITYEDRPSDKSMEDPLSILNKVIEEAPDTTKTRIEKRAARLIVIRRIKMNKHKLQKLRKKMKIVWARIKLRREIRKEKAFLNEKLVLIREAQRFDAKEHVAMLIAKAKEKPLPLRYKGKRFPVWFIKEQIRLGNIKMD